ncbi:Transcription factor [Cinnamomum micranthum f. kanehirae]|uniref:Transcription factor n=1 Tax=Cinnamomum micranthum f. kanehirae TaxID=337451 RepID=A0A3S3P0P3_9MAGN|nr:Transcription factor [Cinnamomum micranthum f. kanehirae]
MPSWWRALLLTHSARDQRPAMGEHKIDSVLVVWNMVEDAIGAQYKGYYDGFDFVIPDLSSSPFFDDPFFPVDEWTKAEDKLFETTLAIYGEDTPDQWEKIAKELPGKTTQQVEEHYRLLVKDVENIESVLDPVPS